MMVVVVMTRIVMIFCCFCKFWIYFGLRQSLLICRSISGPKHIHPKPCCLFFSLTRIFSVLHKRILLTASLASSELPSAADDDQHIFYNEPRFSSCLEMMMAIMMMTMMVIMLMMMLTLLLHSSRLD